MAGVRFALQTALVCAAALLAACDNGPSAVAERRDEAPAVVDSRPDARPVETARGDARAAPVPTVDGKPMWSANRRYTAQENAQRHFERNGEAFGTRDVDDFVRKAHAFVNHPPKGVQTIKRDNGDTLFYDAKANVFAVATRDGAPRTMFKPDDGADYWETQKAREARRETARSDRADREDS